MARLSLCMILKDEEKRLAACLQSAVPIVDEIIVVDTGSTDRTMEIAREHGAKVYEHKWEDHFARHRNQSLSYAGGDWVLILDADEALDPETAPLIRKAVDEAGPEVGCIYVQLYNVLSDGRETFVLHPRLFRREGFHYEGAVHNRPIYEGAADQCPAKLYHYGYGDDEAVMKLKHQRRLAMVRAWVEREPENFVPWSYLAQTLSADEDANTHTVEAAQKAVELHQAQKAQTPPALAYYAWITALVRMGKSEEVIRVCDQCLEVIPYYPDPLFYQAWAWGSMGQWAQVCRSVQRFLSSQEDAGKNPRRFAGVENLTANRIDMAIGFWREAAKRCAAACACQEAA